MFIREYIYTGVVSDGLDSAGAVDNEVFVLINQNSLYNKCIVNLEFLQKLSC